MRYSPLLTVGHHVEPSHPLSLPLSQPGPTGVVQKSGKISAQTTNTELAFLTRTVQFPLLEVEVEDDNETVGTRWRNTTNTTPGSYYQEDPPNYPHQLIMQLLQNFTAVPGLFDTLGNRDVVSLVSVHHNNLDLDLEILK